jgi:hypothetical protein
MSALILTICGVITGIAAVAVILWKVIAFVMQIYKRVLLFLDDWQGEPDRDGVPGRKGVMARLCNIEHEVKRNDGSSLKDAVHRIEKKLTEVENTLHEHIDSQADGS